MLSSSSPYYFHYLSAPSGKAKRARQFPTRREKIPQPPRPSTVVGKRISDLFPAPAPANPAKKSLLIILTYISRLRICSMSNVPLDSPIWNKALDLIFNPNKIMSKMMPKNSFLSCLSVPSHHSTTSLCSATTGSTGTRGVYKHFP